MSRLRAIFWAVTAAIFIASIMPLSVKVPGDPSDKLQHFAAFILLAALAAAAYPKTHLLRIGVGFAAFGGLIEIVQGIPALNRFPEWLDWAADIGGATIALAAAALIRKMRKE